MRLPAVDQMGAQDSTLADFPEAAKIPPCP